MSGGKGGVGRRVGYGDQRVRVATDVEGGWCGAGKAGWAGGGGEYCAGPGLAGRI